MKLVIETIRDFSRIFDGGMESFFLGRRYHVEDSAFMLGRIAAGDAVPVGIVGEDEASLPAELLALVPDAIAFARGLREPPPEPPPPELLEPAPSAHDPTSED